MTLVINKSNSKKLKEILKSKLGKPKEKGNLSKHFGTLKRNLDGLEYQKKMRENED